MKRILSSLSACTAFVLRYCKLSFIAGSKTAFFSASQIAGPLVGLYGGWQASLINYSVRTVLLTVAMPSLSWLSLLAYHIPTTSASAYLGTQSRLRAILPIVAIVAYLIHPVGIQAPWYALYWLIPLAAVFNTRFLFIQTLGATFTAHALGTIIYLYSGLLTYEALCILTPLVALERLTYAIGMTTAVWGINLATKSAKNINLASSPAQEPIA